MNSEIRTEITFAVMLEGQFEGHSPTESAVLELLRSRLKRGFGYKAYRIITTEKRTQEVEFEEIKP